MAMGLDRLAGRRIPLRNLPIDGGFDERIGDRAPAPAS